MTIYLTAAVLAVAFIGMLQQDVVVTVSAERHPDHTLGPAPLTYNAERTDFVVLAQAVSTSAMSDFCDSSSSDWRGWMPIYLSRELGPDRPLIVSDQLPMKGRPGRCRMCYTGDEQERNTYFDCEDWFHSRGSNHTKFVIVVGTGRGSAAAAGGGSCRSNAEPTCFPNILDILNAPWVHPRKTTVWHFPITRIPSVDANKIFPAVHRNFHVMQDGAWLKPVQREGLLSKEIDQCASRQPKRNVLLYVARYHRWKGQRDFLQYADPELLKGYTVVFFTSAKVTPNNGTTEAERLEVLAKQRGIDVVVNYKPKSQEAVAAVACRAKGLIHFARRDANPRAVTESIINGLQVFVSKEANVPDAILKQRFVTVTTNSNGHTPAATLNKDLKKFMSMLDSPENRASLVSFTKEQLDPRKAYLQLCRKLGICA
mmetsp:Transcript_34087/g.85900  ORF Transcript_34087/g.85900 Transcript_34087/m.85900 type:complete len:427 (-) Transcript_34087:161-1441(-)